MSRYDSPSHLTAPDISRGSGMLRGEKGGIDVGNFDPGFEKHLGGGGGFFKIFLLSFSALIYDIIHR